MSRLQAESFPYLHLLHRSLAREKTARTVLRESATDFSPRLESIQFSYSPEPGEAIVLDIQGMDGLFGSPETLATKLRQRASTHGLLTNVATSMNFHAAICAARGMSGVNSLKPGEEASTLSQLPLYVLDLTPKMEDTFRLWGIRNCGMLAALPERELVARVGFEGQKLRALARGQYPHHFRPIEQDFASQLVEVIELDHPVEVIEPPLFLLARLLDQLLLRTQTRSLAIASIEVQLKLDQTSKGQAGHHIRTIRPALPSQDARRLLKLIQLDLESHPPGAAVLALTMRVTSARPHVVQHGLFVPQGPEPDRLEVLLARLKNLLGEEYVGVAQLLDTRSENGFRMREFAPPPMRDEAVLSIETNPAAAFRVCRPPLAIGVTLRTNQPVAITVEGQSFAIVTRAGPWRRSGEWWSQTNWCREEWDVVLSDRTTQRICRIAYDPNSRCWYLAGAYD
jgi:protein ImuB